MDFFTYQELIEAKFEQYQPPQNGEEFPECMGLERNNVTLIAKYAARGDYVIHCAGDVQRRIYNETDLQEERFDGINTIDALIEELSKRVTTANRRVA